MTYRVEQLAAVLNERGDHEDGLPTTIRGLVAARLDALPPEEREVILDASIVGRIFWRGGLERIACPRGEVSEVADWRGNQHKSARRFGEAAFGISGRRMRCFGGHSCS